MDLNLQTAMRLSRMADPLPAQLNEVFAAEQTISAMSDEDWARLEETVHRQPQDGWVQLWRGLVLAQRGRNAEAAEAFALAVQRGFRHWRAAWYIAQSAAVIKQLELVDQACAHVLNCSPEFWPARELPKHARGYYAQLGQDRVVEEFFKWQAPKTKVFVEVGAFDGVHYSNVRRLQERYGWTGLCIEPVQKNFEKLARSYGGTTVKCVRAAVGLDQTEVAMHVSTYPHLPDWGSDVANLTGFDNQRWQRQYGATWTRETVPARSLTTLLDEAGIGSFDFLSIDAEGQDLSVLKSLDFARFAPQFLVVEYGAQRKAIADFLAHYGYSLLEDNGQDLLAARVQGSARGRLPDLPARNFTGLSGKPGYLEIQQEMEQQLHSWLDQSPDQVERIVIVGGFRGHEVREFLLRYPKAEIHIFEPSRRYFPQLQAAYANDCRVKCHSLAVSDQTGSATFNEGTLDGVGSLLPLKTKADRESWIPSNLLPGESYPVAVVTLDEFEPLKDKPIDLLWCDVQGAELKVLAGATRVLRQTRALFLEVATTRTTYHGQCQLPDLDLACQRHGFYLAGIGLCPSGNGTGNALWLRLSPALEACALPTGIRESGATAALQGAPTLPLERPPVPVSQRIGRVEEAKPLSKGIGRSPVPRIVGLVPARNEGARIGFCLRSLAQFTDAIVYLDDCSEDDSVAIVESLAGACQVERIIRKRNWDRDEPGDRNALLRAGREIGGTHFVVLDADEAFTANCRADGFMRQLIRGLARGDSLALQWIQLWRGLDYYRHDHSVWTGNLKRFAFCDDGKCSYESEFIHTPRVPVNLTGRSLVVSGCVHAVLHFQFANWRNLLVKQAWYRCLERLREPHKPVVAINERYAPSKDERGLGLRRVPVAWLSGYEGLREAMLAPSDSWREKQVLDWFEKHGQDHFKELDIWDIPWGKSGQELPRSDAFIAAVQRAEAESSPRETALEGVPSSLPTLSHPQPDSAPLVSAIVSAYQSERFMRGCLEDLERQTIAAKMEIVVVDSASPQNERGIVEEFQRRFANIVYIRTAERETIYGAWNRAIRAARGKYITNANTDDRHRRDALEIMVRALEENPGVALVYADVYVTRTENLTFEEAQPTGHFKWLDFNAIDLLHKGCFVGPQPMWRKEIHEEHGFFDPDFVSAGDYEFWLRIARNQKFLHLKETLGLYLEAPQSIEHRHQEKAAQEVAEARRRYEAGLLRLAPSGSDVPLKQPIPSDSGVRDARVHRAPPRCAELGALHEARRLLGRKKLREAWEATRVAIHVRPFHPEAYLLLAEIALAAGDSAAARRSAQYSQRLAPAWQPPRKFLKGKLRGNAHLDWLVLPAAAQANSPSAKRSTPSLTICLIAKNEAAFIRQCLTSVAGLGAQIVLVDTGSNDQTAEIARELGAQVFHCEWRDDFSAARNVALEHATGDWILMLDADEELPAPSHRAFLKLLEVAEVMAWRLPIVDVGREEEGNSYVPRLFRNTPGAHYVGRIHEQVFGSVEAQRQLWGLDNRLGDAVLLHHGYQVEVVRDRHKIERNLRLLTQALDECPGDANLFMNYGLELVRSGKLEEGVAQYRKAFAQLSKSPASLVVPELRETLLSQFSTHLMALKQYKEIVHVLTSPLAQAGGLSASLHFALGLALMEVKNYQEAATNLESCISKRVQPSLAPGNKEIQKAGPRHCLAICLKQLGLVKAADEQFRQAIEEDPGAPSVRLEYARFLSDRQQPVEALNSLFQLTNECASISEAWILGGDIALSRPDYLEVALDWTLEAQRHFPEDRGILRQRAEALMLAGQGASAASLWHEVNPEADPRAAAALVLCEALGTACRFVPERTVEPTVSDHFVKWYQRLLSFGRADSIQRVNSRLDTLRNVLPTAARTLEAAIAEANETHSCCA